MTTYVDPNPRTRRFFFIALAVLGALALVAARIEDLLPPLSNDPIQALDETTNRLLVATILNTLVNIVFSVIAVHLTRRAVQSRQWPPKGMNVPFRTRVTAIERPTVAWAFLAVVLCLFVFQSSLRVSIYIMARSGIEETKRLLEVSPNNTFNRTSGSLRAAFGRLT